MIGVNLEKAREITHGHRRATRDELMKPLDLKSMIPMYAEQAEKERQTIRDENAEMQLKIDKAKSVEELKALV